MEGGGCSLSKFGCGSSGRFGSGVPSAFDKFALERDDYARRNVYDPLYAKSDMYGWARKSPKLIPKKSSKSAYASKSTRSRPKRVKSTKRKSASSKRSKSRSPSPTSSSSSSSRKKVVRRILSKTKDGRNLY